MFHEISENPQDPALAERSRDAIRTVTSSTFELLVLHGQGPIAVEFMTYGCAHCRAIEPALQQVAEMVKATEKIFKVNIAIDSALAEKFGVRGTPTFVMFLDGQEAGRVAGPAPTVASVLTVVTQPFR